MHRKREGYLENEDRTKQLRIQREEKVKLKGKYEQEKEEHERQLVRRKDMVREVASKHQMRGFDDLSEESLVEDFLFKVKKALKDQKATLDRTKLEHSVARREAHTLFNKLTERKAALQDNKASTKKQMDSNDREAGEFQKRVDQISVDEGSKAVIESRIDDLNTKIGHTRQAAEDSDWEGKLQFANNELRSHEEKNSRLNDEMIQSTKRAGELARLSLLKQELKERERSLETLLNAHGDRIKKLIGRDCNPATVEKAYQDVLSNGANEALTAERQRDSIGRELEQVQFKHKTLRDDLLRKKTEAEKADKQIRAVVEEGPEGYEDALQQAEAYADSIREDNNGFVGLHDYYQKVLETIREKSACRTCSRAFKGPTDPALTNTKKRMEALVQQTLARAEQVGAKEAEAEYKRLLDLRVACDSWKKLVKSEIPAAEAELADLGKQRDSLVTKMEKHDKIVEHRQQEKRDIESIGRIVASISKCDEDIKALNGQVEEVSAKQSQQGGGRTLEEIREEQGSVAEKVRGAQTVINRLRTEQEQSRVDLSGMELELSNLKGKLNAIGHQLDKKADLVARVQYFRLANQKLREALDKFDMSIEKLDPEILAAEAKYEDLDQRATAKEQEMSNQQSRLSESVNGLDLLNDQVRSYVDRDGPSQLGRINRELNCLEQELDSLQDEQGRMTRDLNKINDQIRDSESTKRRYSDNLRFRQETRALAQLRKEIEELENQDAETDRDKFESEAQKYTQEHNKLSAQQSGLMGEMKSKDAQLGELLADYNTDLIDAPQRYKEAHIKVEATKAAVEDLGRYGGALNKAIMKYHSLKMGEINNIIEDLWRKTYRGSDVDTITIRADSESGRGNRSYNYRVVMIKKGAEMDMRGRCSAGQKVLASIIIRLALAECFSAQCGLIALDEPTTNLDRDNINSLADSLRGIIKNRQAQSNFQLIVITHDEEFLRRMQCQEFTDHYYRVSRNHNADSIIENQRIAEVM